jgi:hypothetical protein
MLIPIFHCTQIESFGGLHFCGYLNSPASGLSSRRFGDCALWEVPGKDKSLQYCMTV